MIYLDTRKMKLNKKLIIIKYWSNTLIKTDINWNVSINYNNMYEHGILINKIQNPTIIVSSWAVVFWKSFNYDFSYIKDEIVKKRIYAALWNPSLSYYWQFFIKDKILLQSLLTHRDLSNQYSKDKITQIIYNIYKNDIKPIIQVNDNDFITDEELIDIRWWDFWDNDKLTALLTILCADIFDEVEIIFNTSINWVLKDWKTIDYIKKDNLDEKYIQSVCNKNDLSSFWTWWMYNKLMSVVEIFKNTKNSYVYIINWKDPRQLKCILDWKKAWTLIK